MFQQLKFGHTKLMKKTGNFNLKINIKNERKKTQRNN